MVCEQPLRYAAGGTSLCRRPRDAGPLCPAASVADVEQMPAQARFARYAGRQNLCLLLCHRAGSSRAWSETCAVACACQRVTLMPCSTCCPRTRFERMPQVTHYKLCCFARSARRRLGGNTDYSRRRLLENSWRALYTRAALYTKDRCDLQSSDNASWLTGPGAGTR
jgi:hypothetical protein